MEINKIYTGNNIDVLRTFPSNSIDSVVTDPPYGISFMNKKWDYDVPSVETWAEVLRVLKPGGHALVACGTRTQHRMAVNLEDAGFEIRDLIGYLYSTDNAFRRLFNSLDLDQRKLFQMALGNENLFGYLYGSGFPKSHNISKAIEKKAGIKPIGKIPAYGTIASRELIDERGWNNINNALIMPPLQTDQAKQWQGWGTALKPAMELWTLCRKPIEGTVANNVLKHGVGGINIDGCRVGLADGEDISIIREDEKQLDTQQQGWGFKGVSRDNKGRFPANIILDGSDEVVSLFPNTPSSKMSFRGNQGGPFCGIDGTGTKEGTNTIRGHNDNGGSAARFFYTPKASQSERNKGLNAFEEKITTDGREKSIDNAYNRGETKRKNIHPTVKPLDLMQYLCRLITKRGGLVLDPFVGSGTTAIAAKLERMDYIGIEIDPEYQKIAEARIKDYFVQYDIFDFMEEN
jgi:DNA modification methylase